MTTSNDRLDRFENDLETVKAILFTVARRYEVSEKRMEATDARIERLSQQQEATLHAIDQLTEAQETTLAHVDVLVGGLDELARRHDETRSHVERILKYLEGQNNNGQHRG